MKLDCEEQKHSPLRRTLSNEKPKGIFYLSINSAKILKKVPQKGPKFRGTRHQSFTYSSKEKYVSTAKNYFLSKLERPDNNQDVLQFVEHNMGNLQNIMHTQEKKLKPCLDTPTKRRTNAFKSMDSHSKNQFLTIFTPKYKVYLKTSNMHDPRLLSARLLNELPKK